MLREDTDPIIRGVSCGNVGVLPKFACTSMNKLVWPSPFESVRGKESGESTASERDRDRERQVAKHMCWAVRLFARPHSYACYEFVLSF